MGCRTSDYRPHALNYQKCASKESDHIHDRRIKIAAVWSKVSFICGEQKYDCKHHNDREYDHRCINFYLEEMLFLRIFINAARRNENAAIVAEKKYGHLQILNFECAKHFWVTGEIISFSESSPESKVQRITHKQELLFTEPPY